MITQAQINNAIKNYAKELCSNPKDPALLLAAECGISQAIIYMMMCEFPECEALFLKRYGEYM